MWYMYAHDEGLDVFRGVDNPPVASLVVQLVTGLSIDLSPTLVVVWVRVYFGGFR